MQLTKRNLRATMLGVGIALSLGAPVGMASAADVPATANDSLGTMSPLNTGYDRRVCNAPGDGTIAIRAGDGHGTTQLARVKDGSIVHVYATHASSPSISPGWATGYGHTSPGVAVHGYFSLEYTCAL